MYHWEVDQEDFLVLAGEGLLLVEGLGAAAQAVDFVHFPPETKHIIVGAGRRAVRRALLLGARENQERGRVGGPTPSTTSPAVPRRSRCGDERRRGGRTRCFEEPRPVPYDGAWLPT